MAVILPKSSGQNLRRVGLNGINRGISKKIMRRVYAVTACAPGLPLWLAPHLGLPQRQAQHPSFLNCPDVGAGHARDGLSLRLIFRGQGPLLQSPFFYDCCNVAGGKSGKAKPP
jgi:hypothetical protein